MRREGLLKNTMTSCGVSQELVDLYENGKSLLNEWPKLGFLDIKVCELLEHPMKIQLLDHAPIFKISDIDKDICPSMKNLTTSKPTSMGIQLEVFLGKRPVGPCMEEARRSFESAISYMEEVRERFSKQLEEMNPTNVKDQEENLGYVKKWFQSILTYRNMIEMEMQTLGQFIM